MFVEEIREKAAKIRNSAQYRLWRNQVLERDKRRCVLCKSKQNKANGIRLEVDHILPFMLYPEKMFDLDNGRTLCSSCHRKTGTYGNSSFHRQAHYETIHPFLKGDYLTKINSLPTAIEFEDQIHGLTIKYKATNKTWVAGYGTRCGIPNLSGWSTESYTADEAIDSLITGLKMASRTN
jgi:hypothetical protein